MASSNASSAQTVAANAQSAASAASSNASAAQAAVENIQIGGRNLLLASKGDFVLPPTHIIDNYVYFYDTRAYMEQGEQYVANGKTDGIWSGAHTPNTESDRILMWLASADGVIHTGISDEHTGTDGTKFTWPYPSGWYILRINAYSLINTHTVWNLKIEKGTNPTDWTPAPEDVQAGIDGAQNVANAASSNAQYAVSTAQTAQAGVDKIKKQWDIDARHLDQNTYYPVTISLNATENVRIEVIVALNSWSIPIWSIHNGGFSCRFVETVNGSGWGTTPVNRIVEISDYAWATDNPVGTVGQMDFSSDEYIHVRGGGFYRFYVSDNKVPVLRTSRYDALGGQFVEPLPLASMDFTTNKTTVLQMANASLYLQEAIKNNSTSIYGGLITSSVIRLGANSVDVAGINGIGSNSQDVRIWAGGTLDQAINTALNSSGVRASFVVTQDGTLYATKAVIEGNIRAGSVGGWVIGSDSLYHKLSDGTTGTVISPDRIDIKGYWDKGGSITQLNIIGDFPTSVGAVQTQLWIEGKFKGSYPNSTCVNIIADCPSGSHACALNVTCRGHADGVYIGSSEYGYTLYVGANWNNTSKTYIGGQVEINGNLSISGELTSGYLRVTKNVQIDGTLKLPNLAREGYAVLSYGMLYRDSNNFVRWRSY